MKESSLICCAGPSLKRTCPADFADSSIVCVSTAITQIEAPDFWVFCDPPLANPGYSRQRSFETLLDHRIVKVSTPDRMFETWAMCPMIAPTDVYEGSETFAGSLSLAVLYCIYHGARRILLTGVDNTKNAEVFNLEAACIARICQRHPALEIECLWPDSPLTEFLGKEAYCS